MTQKDDFSLSEFLPFLLNRAAEESSLGFQKAYKDRYGMLRTEWRVLFHLGIYGQMTAKEICARANIHKTKISRAVVKLEERRFVSRKRDAADRRSEHLTLTAAGEAAYHDLRKVATDYDEKLVAQFGTEDVQLLRRMLRKLAYMEG